MKWDLTRKTLGFVESRGGLLSWRLTVESALRRAFSGHEVLRFEGQ